MDRNDGWRVGSKVNKTENTHDKSTDFVFSIGCRVHAERRMDGSKGSKI
jgi:hypothetical protein